MNKAFYIIIGRSGCGKGTQAELLKEKLEKRGAEKVLHVTTGGGFREFIAGDSHAAKLSHELTNTGGLNPEFLAVWNWSNIFINNLSGNETVILDGAPRRMGEVEPLHSAIQFFGYGKPTVIHLNVSETWAMDKLASRGREDDSQKEEQEKKMQWFNEDVLPCLDAYSRDSRYSFIHVNGEQTIEEVHNEILEKLNLQTNNEQRTTSNDYALRHQD
jgi:adenylate kinase family enzyme